MKHIFYCGIILFLIRNTVASIFTEWRQDEEFEDVYAYNETLSPNIENLTTLSPCSINVTWSCNECVDFNPTKFAIYWTTNGTEVSDEVENTTYNYPISGLNAATNYSIRVSAVYNNDEEEEYDSNSQYQKTNPGEPPDIDYIGVDPNSINETSLSLTWNTTYSDCPLEYSIQWNGSVLCTENYDIGSTLTDQTSYVITGLTPYTNYLITIAAVSTDGLPGNPTEKPDVITEESDPPDITNATVIEVTDTTILLNWTISENLEKCPIMYTVSVSGPILCSTSGKIVSTSQDSGETEVLLYGLTADTNYTITINSVSYSGKTGNLYTVEENAVTDESVPGAPENPTSNTLNSSSVEVSWEAPLLCNGNLLDYIIYWKFTDNDTTVWNVTTSELTYEVDNLVECGTYEFFVQATTSVGAGEAATTTSRTLAEEPPPMEILNSRNLTSTTVILTWEPPDTHCPVLNYTLEGFGTVLWDDDRNVTRGETVPGNETLYEAEDLVPWTNYSVCITAFTEGGTSDAVCTDLQTLEDVPSEPENLKNKVLSSSKVRLTWDPPEELNGELENYNIYYTGDSGNTINVTTVEEEYTLEGLSACVQYDVSVVGVTDVGEGNPATTTPTLDAEIPPAPIIKPCEMISSTSIEVRWSAPTTACEIQIYEISALGLILWNNETTLHVETTNELKITLSGLVPYTEYVITVRARTSVGYSEQNGSNNSCPMATSQDKPGMPANTTVPSDSITSDSFTVTWMEPTSINGNLLGFKLVLNNETYQYIRKTSAKAYSEEVTNLDSNTNYIINVFAETDIGFGSPSETKAETLSSGNLGLALGITIPLLVILVALALGYYYRDDIRKSMKTERTHPIGHAAVSSDFSTIPILLSQLRSYSNKLESDIFLDSEFNSLAARSYKGATSEGNKSENAIKNRYANIIPFDATRVILARGLSTYINANYINSFLLSKFFIATQGPTDFTLEDFWNLIWQEHVDTIVMLTQCDEKGKDKCTLYWPKPLSGFGTELGAFTIHNINEEVTPLFAFRMFEVVHRGENRKRLIKHYQYLTWPDFGVPSKEEDLLRVLCTVKQHLSLDRKDNKLLVHCSAGVGRTGTFICLWNIIEAINYGVQSLSIAKEVLELRRQRVQMVQSKEQYRYLCQCVLQYYENQAKWKIKSKDAPENSGPLLNDEANTSSSAFYNMSFEPAEDFEGNLI